MANTLNMHMGFTFSQGGIDFLMFNLIGGKAQGAGYVFIIGPIYAAIYYATFRFVITRLNLKTPGREDATDGAAAQNMGVGKTGKALAIWSSPLAVAATSPASTPALPVCALR